MIYVGIGDEEEVLMDGCRCAAANAEGSIEGGDHNARLEATDREPLDEMPFDLHALLVHLLPPRPPLLFFFLYGAVDCREKSRPFDRGWTLDVIG